MKSPKSQLKPSGLPSSSRPLLSILTLSPPATLRTLRRALLPPAVRLRLPSLLDTLISSAPIDSSPVADSVSSSAAALTSTVPPATTEVPAAPTLPAPLDLAALLANAQLQAGSVASLHGIPIEYGPRLPIGIPVTGHLTGSLPTVPQATPVLDAETTASLHSQAVSVLNVKALVPITLDIAAANYSKWRGLFLVTLGKYALTDHVFSNAFYPNHAHWLQMDCVVLGWLYGSISVDLLETVMTPNATARLVWLALENQFLGNREQHALHLSAKFRNIIQGDLNVTDYCRRIKSMADRLANLGEPVRDRSLVLCLLNGLNEKYDHLKTLLPMQHTFPTFIEAHSQLLLEELTKSHQLSSSPATAFIASTASGGNHSDYGGLLSYS